ncbi:MAG: hypothetical protein VX640_06680 [Pseudomonadota bacterium]|nr:hypothetical protein [Pseudomonadota bacterium]
MVDWVLLRNFFDPEEAVVVRSLLHSEGFATTLGNENLLNANPALRVAVGGYPLMVRPEQRASAEELLRGAEAAALESADAAACSACGGRFFRAERSFMWAGVGFAFGVPFTHKTGRSICTSCGAAFETAAGRKGPTVALALIGAVLAAYALWAILYGFLF